MAKTSQLVQLYPLIVVIAGATYLIGLAMPH